MEYVWAAPTLIELYNQQMDISRDDAVAHLAKWRDGDTPVRAVYTTITGNISIVGKISDLSAAAIKISAEKAEMLLYFRATSMFDYKDVRQVVNQTNKDRVNQYPTVIDIKFNN